MTGSPQRPNARTDDTGRPAPFTPRLIEPGVGVDLSAHTLRHGPVPLLSGLQVIEAVDQAGLTGRGGAAFPTGRKLATVAAAAGRRGAIVIANGCEGEPLSRKDTTLLAGSPHLVLDGIELAARAVRAGSAHLCLHSDEQDLHDIVAQAVAQRRISGADAVEITLVRVPHRYVSSEETALVRRINGGPALPAFTPPRPFERGVGGRPTLVDNVETLAHLALIARHGPGWFRGAGTRKAPGTTLVTVVGAVRAPGVYEVPLGVSGEQLLATAGGAAEPVQAVLCGGYFGAWLAADRFERAEISAPGLAAAGAAIGAGVFFALPRHACGLVTTARITRYLAEQSAGQCGPCLNGLPALAEALEILASVGGDTVTSTIKPLVPFIEGRGACRHPDGAVRLIDSALREFADDVRAHRMRRLCPGATAPGAAVPQAAASAPARRYHA